MPKSPKSGGKGKKPRKRRTPEEIAADKKAKEEARIKRAAEKAEREAKKAAEKKAREEKAAARLAEKEANEAEKAERKRLREEARKVKARGAGKKFSFLVQHGKKSIPVETETVFCPGTKVNEVYRRVERIVRYSRRNHLKLRNESISRAISAAKKKIRNRLIEDSPELGKDELKSLVDEEFGKIKDSFPSIIPIPEVKRPGKIDGGGKIPEKNDKEYDLDDPFIDNDDKEAEVTLDGKEDFLPYVIALEIYNINPDWCDPNYNTVAYSLHKYQQEWEDDIIGRDEKEENRRTRDNKRKKDLAKSAMRDLGMIGDDSDDEGDMFVGDFRTEMYEEIWGTSFPYWKYENRALGLDNLTDVEIAEMDNLPECHTYIFEDGYHDSPKQAPRPCPPYMPINTIAFTDIHKSLPPDIGDIGYAEPLVRILDDDYRESFVPVATEMTDAFYNLFSLHDGLVSKREKIGGKNTRDLIREKVKIINAERAKLYKIMYSHTRMEPIPGDADPALWKEPSEEGFTYKCFENYVGRYRTRLATLIASGFDYKYCILAAESLYEFHIFTLMRLGYFLDGDTISMLETKRNLEKKLSSKFNEFDIPFISQNLIEAKYADGGGKLEDLFHPNAAKLEGEELKEYQGYAQLMLEIYFKKMENIDRLAIQYPTVLEDEEDEEEGSEDIGSEEEGDEEDEEEEGSLYTYMRHLSDRYCGVLDMDGQGRVLEDTIKYEDDALPLPKVGSLERYERLGEELRDCVAGEFNYNINLTKYEWDAGVFNKFNGDWLAVAETWTEFVKEIKSQENQEKNPLFFEAYEMIEGLIKATTKLDAKDAKITKEKDEVDIEESDGEDDNTGGSGETGKTSEPEPVTPPPTPEPKPEPKKKKRRATLITVVDPGRNI